MAGLRRKIPPLTALLVFEAAARLHSFTKAALELGVTQAAVSRQIHLLEASLGFPLFKRLHRHIELTEKGAALSATSTNAFNILAETVADITGGGLEEQLVISATVSFSQFWLLPKVSSFSRAHPDIKIRIVSQDKRWNTEDSDVDLSIRYGNGTWADGQAEFLFNDQVFPVCSPEYAAQIGEVTEPADLIPHPLITYDSDDPSWIGWDEWLTAFSTEPPKRRLGMRCSFYTDSIHAALNGQGIALGWQRLVDDLLRQGRLVRILPHVVPTRNAYFIVVPRKRQASGPAAKFGQWLRAHATMDMHAPEQPRDGEREPVPLIVTSPQ